MRVRNPQSVCSEEPSCRLAGRDPGPTALSGAVKSALAVPETSSAAGGDSGGRSPCGPFGSKYRNKRRIEMVSPPFSMALRAASSFPAVSARDIARAIASVTRVKPCKVSCRPNSACFVRFGGRRFGPCIGFKGNPSFELSHAYPQLNPSLGSKVSLRPDSLPKGKYPLARGPGEISICCFVPVGCEKIAFAAPKLDASSIP
mmetsp:Transcript_20958/g.57680  ORF Transcript_20958/g.57680 Transcript_20958/m.57680 type:complete len:202 (+) Transcript_20958:1189-1794(+)